MLSEVALEGLQLVGLGSPCGSGDALVSDVPWQKNICVNMIAVKAQFSL